MCTKEIIGMKRSKPMVIGITGGVGAGKSEVLHYLGNKDQCQVYELDKIAHQLQQPGQKCHGMIVEHFGKDILNEVGAIDRERLSEKVFANKVSLDTLNEIIHPQVMEYIELQIKGISKEIQIIVIEGALLIEAGYRSCCDEFWYIHASKEVRLARVIEARGYTKEKFEGIHNNQLEDSVFMKECDRIIDNSQGKEVLYTNIENQLKVLLGE